jgi:hypothetical protein
MTARETQLEEALRANAALRVQAERLIAAYVAPESDRAWARRHHASPFGL